MSTRRSPSPIEEQLETPQKEAVPITAEAMEDVEQTEPNKTSATKSPAPSEEQLGILRREPLPTISEVMEDVQQTEQDNESASNSNTPMREQPVSPQKDPITTTDEASENPEPMEGIQQAAPKTYKTTEKGLRISEEILRNARCERQKNSPVSRTRSIEDQALRYPATFVGEEADGCTYIDLSDTRNHDRVAGEYRIVFTRSAGRYDTYDNNETFKPSSLRSITVKTDIHDTKRGTLMHTTLAQHNWAALEFNFNGQTMVFGLDRARFSRRQVSPTPAELMAQPTTFPNGKSRLDKVLEVGVNAQGRSSVFFGVRTMREASDVIQHSWVTSGFEFLELDLCCVEPTTSEQDRQVVIAVKLNLSEQVPDVGSAFLLTQQLSSEPYGSDSKFDKWEKYEPEKEE